MPIIRLRNYKSEMIAGRPVGTFELSELPDGAWIGRFEECLGNLSKAGFAVLGDQVRAELLGGRNLDEVVQLVQQCIDAANQNGQGPDRPETG